MKNPAVANSGSSAFTPASLSGSKYDELVSELMRQRAKLLQEAARSSARLEIETFPDTTDQASAEADQSFLLSLKERERNLLQQIDEALGRIATNTYGICESCNQEIPLKRLKARPMTTLCVSCKAQQEMEDKLRD